MNWRYAIAADLERLAAWNRELQEDEGSDPMSSDDLVRRLTGWLATDYRAVIFETLSDPIGYALFRVADPDLQGPDTIYLRHFFVSRSHRRGGYGSRAFEILVRNVFQDQKIVLEALNNNPGGQAFWESQGFEAYSVTYQRESKNIE